MIGRGRVPRWTIRTRLAVLYAVVFLAAGGVLLGVTYTLMRQAIFSLQINTAVVSDPGPDPAVTPVDPLAEMDRLNKLEAYRTAVSDEAREATLNSMTRTLGIGLVVLVVGGFGLGWLVARQSLRPVQRITATARRVAGGNLDERIGLQGPADELKELADTFDEMVRQLGAAFDSQKRFVANASHELRTPLAINRTLIEVALGDPEAPVQVRDLGAALLRNTERQERMIDGLLALAESERRLTVTVPVHLGELVQHAVQALAGEAAAAEVVVDVGVSESACEVQGDPVLLEQLVVNLVQNAIRHNVAGGQAWVSCQTTHDGVVIRVANTGRDMGGDQLGELFEPFRRGSPRLAPRQVSRRGNGLGLSIVRAVASVHGGSVSAEPRIGGGLIVVAAVPLRSGGGSHRLR